MNAWLQIEEGAPTVLGRTQILIFLFNKEVTLYELPPAIPKTPFSTENDLEIKVGESLMMHAVFHTVVSRTLLVVEMFEVTKNLSSFCEVWSRIHTKAGLQAWPIWRTVQILTQSYFSSLKILIRITCNP